SFLNVDTRIDPPAYLLEAAKSLDFIERNTVPLIISFAHRMGQAAPVLPGQPGSLATPQDLKSASIPCAASTLDFSYQELRKIVRYVGGALDYTPAKRASPKDLASMADRFGWNNLSSMALPACVIIQAQQVIRKRKRQPASQGPRPGAAANMTTRSMVKGAKEAKSGSGYTNVAATASINRVQSK
ncbi:hypothetical protein HDU93_009421, partial [Gonapodya sp. JEL0774]